MKAKKAKLDAYLEDLVDSFNVPQDMYLKALDRFGYITKHLTRPESSLGKYDISLYPQGSFNLGTAIKPFEDDGHYDVDIICEIDVNKDDISQEDLKELVGREIKDYHRKHDFKNKIEDNRRCWTLLYAEEEQFHVDILPAIPDGEYFLNLLKDAGKESEWSDLALAMTDKTHPKYSEITDDWYTTNPKGYAEWFNSKIRKIIKKIAEEREVNVEDIKPYLVDSTLQKAVKILKRHRDISFQNDYEIKPISAIITTLAADYYNPEDSLSDTLIHIIDKMSTLIRENTAGLMIPHPANPLEFFTDKWEETPEKEKAFRDWVDKLDNDFCTALKNNDIGKITEIFGFFADDNKTDDLKNKCVQTNTISNANEIRKNTALISFNVPHKRQLEFPENISGTVDIIALVGRPGFRPIQVHNNSDAIDKHCSLRFEATTSIRRPYKVYWQVVNTGYEARINNSLRGDFYDGFVEKGKLVRKESTLYTGNHWVQCFIVKNKICVAKSEEFVININ